MYGEVRKDVVEILKHLCQIEGIELIEGAVCKDHVHMYVSILPKTSISSGVSRLKGKSALMLYDRHPEFKDRNGRSMKYGLFGLEYREHTDNRVGRNHLILYRATLMQRSSRKTGGSGNADTYK